MDIEVKTLDGKKSGKVSVSDAIFGLEPREDIVARMVRYQRAKARQGTHQTQGRSDVDRTGSGHDRMPCENSNVFRVAGLRRPIDERHVPEPPRYCSPRRQ